MPARPVAAGRRERAHVRTSPSAVALRFFLAGAGLLALLAGPLTGTAAAAPANDSLPSVSGNQWVGQTLTLTPGQWSNVTSTSERWQDCDSGGDVCAPIPGATGDAYAVTAGDLGYTIGVAETATAPDGSTSTAFAKRTATVAPPSNQSPPTISGMVVQGQTLTATRGAWTNQPTAYTYQWDDCNGSGSGCTPIAGATDSSYTVAPGDTGSTFVVQETAFDESTASSPVSSSTSGVAQTGSSVTLAASPGNVAVNQAVVLAATVTAQSGSATPTGSMTFTDDGTAITGCSGVAVSAGAVRCQTSFPAGQAQLAVTFDPAAGSVVLGSTSPVVTLPVVRDTLRIALRAGKQVMAGTRLTDTATLSLPAQPERAFAPTGTIEFLDHGKPLAGCTKQRMVKLAATCSTTYVLPGKQTLTAAYRGDANFDAVTSSASALNVTPIPVDGAVTSTLSWTFYFTPSYTSVVHLVLLGVPYGSSVQLGCHGHGCPFASRPVALPKARPCADAPVTGCPASNVSMTASLVGRQLGIGAQITVMVAHARYVGKYYSFTIRARAQPRVRIACLAPDSPIPGADCSFGQTTSGVG